MMPPRSSRLSSAVSTTSRAHISSTIASNSWTARPYPSLAVATTPDHRPSIAPVVGPDDPRRFTDSGIEIAHVYTEEDVKPGLEERLGDPGGDPLTPGIPPDMYPGRKGAMRQYAGYATATETNERF